MDILFCAKWRKPLRGSASDRLYSSGEPSGLNRLLLAVAVIAAIVIVLDHAARTNADAHPSSNRPGELP